MTSQQRAILTCIANMPRQRLGEFSLTVPDKRLAARLTNAGLLQRVECRRVVAWELTEEGREALAPAPTPAVTAGRKNGGGK